MRHVNIRRARHALLGLPRRYRRMGRAAVMAGCCPARDSDRASRPGMVSIANAKLTKLTGQKNMKLRSNQQLTRITKLIVILGALPAIIIATRFIAYAASPTPAPSANPLITWTAGGKQSKN